MITTLLFFQIFATVFGYNGGSNKDSLFIAQTGSPALLDSAGISLALSEEEYNKIADQHSTSKYFIRISQKPTQLSSGARFGSNLTFGGFNRSWVIDGDEKQGYKLYADLNANGNLSDDSLLKFSHINSKYSVMLQTDAIELNDGKEEKYPVQMKLEVDHVVPPGKTEKQLALKDYSKTQRKGVLQIGKREISFALTGAQGIYNFGYNWVSFDFNGDGTFSPIENYDVREKYVNVGDSSYEFQVDRYGRSLTLRLLSERLTGRASLEIGSQVPEFSFKDLNGQVHHLSDYRGKVLLLDFWGYWCGPCVAEAPALAATYSDLHPNGFDIIGIHNGEDTTSVKKFISQHKMNWNQTIEGDDGPIQKLFRIKGYPTYFLIGKNGTIISNTLRPGEELSRNIVAGLKDY
jgi:thiol-disulfide isomerase/thioredoxin